jgi:hypothetical protein
VRMPAHEAWIAWRSVMFKHWLRDRRRCSELKLRRGFARVLLRHCRLLWHHRPEPVIAWRMAVATRWICRGCPMNRVPRYLRRSAAFTGITSARTLE